MTKNSQNISKSSVKSNAKFIGVLTNDNITELINPLFKLSAGIPCTPTEDIQVVDLNNLCLTHPKTTVLFQAGGQSMLKAGIDDSDYLLVNTAQEAKNGQIIAASYFDDTVVKSYHQSKSGIILKSHNTSYDDVIIEHPDFLNIIGVVTWVLADKRKFSA